VLIFLKRSKHGGWIFFEQFDLKVKHRAGTSHRAADALSRRPCDDTGLCPQCSKRRNGWVEKEVLYWRAAIIPSEDHFKVTTRCQARKTPYVSTQSDGAPIPSGGSHRPNDGAPGQTDRPSVPSDGTPSLSGAFIRPSDGESRQKGIVFSW